VATRTRIRRYGRLPVRSLWAPAPYRKNVLRIYEPRGLGVRRVQPARWAGSV